jgi:hypothetical protein
VRGGRGVDRAKLWGGDSGGEKEGLGRWDEKSRFGHDKEDTLIAVN